MKRHLTRKELITATNALDKEIKGHLNACRECHEAFELLNAYRVAGAKHLLDAPTGWIEKASLVMRPHGALKRLRSLAAKLVFDSWAIPYPVGVRGENALDERRIRFEAGDLRFDLRAERSDREWSFVAEVSGKEALQDNPLLVADKQKLLPDDSGFYQWTGKKPPKILTLHTEKLTIKLPELVWKKPKST